MAVVLDLDVAVVVVGQRVDSIVLAVGLDCCAVASFRDFAENFGKKLINSILFIQKFHFKNKDLCERCGYLGQIFLN